MPERTPSRTPKRLPSRSRPGANRSRGTRARPLSPRGGGGEALTRRDSANGGPPLARRARLLQMRILRGLRRLPGRREAGLLNAGHAGRLLKCPVSHHTLCSNTCVSTPVNVYGAPSANLPRTSRALPPKPFLHQLLRRTFRRASASFGALSPKPVCFRTLRHTSAQLRRIDAMRP